MIFFSHGELGMVFTDKKTYRKLVWCVPGMYVWGPLLAHAKVWWSWVNYFIIVEHKLLWHELCKVIWFVSRRMQCCGLRLGGLSSGCTNTTLFWTNFGWCRSLFTWSFDHGFHRQNDLQKVDLIREMSVWISNFCNLQSVKMLSALFDSETYTVDMDYLNWFGL